MLCDILGIMATDPSDIKLSAEYRRMLAQLADRLGKSPQDILDEALGRYADVPDAVKSANNSSGKSLFEAMQEVGAVASCADGPSDLSTNPEYMEGFGKDN